jgi:hypothetical protein
MLALHYLASNTRVGNANAVQACFNSILAWLALAAHCARRYLRNSAANFEDFASSRDHAFRDEAKKVER